MPDLPIFQTKEGLSKLSNILHAYALRSPDVVGYCQGTNIICAGLLQVLEEEDAFWALCVLVEARLGYYAPSMISLKVDQSVLQRVVSFRLPRLSKHMESLGVSVFHFTTSWFLCLFMKDPLLVQDAIELWDYIFCYGDEVLFLMAIELLKTQEETMLEIKEADEMLTFVLHGIMKSNPVRCDTFHRVLKDIGSIALQIETLRTYFQQSLCREVILEETGKGGGNYLIYSSREMTFAGKFYCGMLLCDICHTPQTHTERVRARTHIHTPAI